MKRYFIALLLFAIFVPLVISAQEFAKGYVFADTNGNGKMDKKERGIANVSVSNGKDVVLTDKNGQYTLPVTNSCFVFVVKPSNYQVAKSANGLPSFYYHHEPLGSPSDFKYKGSSPTGTLPKSINFALTSRVESDTFKALVLGDPQPSNEQKIEYLKKSVIDEIVNDVDKTNIAFGISLGDIADNVLSLHQPYIKAMQPIGLPWYYVKGNHDMNYDAKVDLQNAETFQHNFGPTNYSFNIGKAHFLVLDDVRYPDPRGGKGYWGGFREDQLTFIENDLKYVSTDKLLVLSVHIPLFDGDTEAFNQKDIEKLFSILKNYPNVLVLSAHTHFQRQNFFGKEHRRTEKPIHEYNVGAICGDWFSGDMDAKGFPKSLMRDGSPVGYAFLNIDGNNYTIDYKVAGQPKEYQISLYHPLVVPYKKSVSSPLFANFFIGHRDDKVEYRIDGEGEWIKMTWSEEFDPTYSAMLYRWDSATALTPSRWPSRPMECTHLWKASISSKLEPGKHAIEVRATDMFGNTFSQTSSYTIVQE